MANISLEVIKSLRAKTGVGIHQVKEALEHAKGDEEKAIIYLREKGLAKAGKRAGNATNHGTIGHYIHGGGTIAVLIEVQSETDFAAKSPVFQNFVKDIAMQVAANAPDYVDVESIPEKVLEVEKGIYAKELKGKPENIQEKILEGKLQNFYGDTVLMKQRFLKDEDKTVEDLLNETVAALGESIKVTKFVRFVLGGESTLAEAKS